MSAGTKIEWTDASWNPVTGCSRVSPGCQHCYAERLTATRLAQQERYRGLAVIQHGEPRWSNEIRVHHEVLTEPLRWRKPRRVFVCSMSDLFHVKVPYPFIDQVFAVMLGCAVLTNHRHVFQVLTKRSYTLASYFELSSPKKHLRRWAEIGNGLITLDNEDMCFDECITADTPWPLPNVWLGVSVEQRYYLNRIDDLRRVPAAVRWVSFEPLLEHLGSVDLTGIHWAVIGGETGPGARPFNVAWAEDLIDQCRAQGVAVFVKQLGSVAVDGRGACAGCNPRTPDDCTHCEGTIEHPRRLRLRDRRGKNLADWPRALRIREWPNAT